MKKENGAFLIIFCTVLTVLLLVSLAVLDISRQRSNADHARYYTKLAALTAIDAYFKAAEEHANDAGGSSCTSSSNPNPCINAAVDAANEFLQVSDINHAVFDSTEKIDQTGYYAKSTVDDGGGNVHYAHMLIQADSDENNPVDMKREMGLSLGYWVNCGNEVERNLDSCAAFRANPNAEQTEKEFFLTESKYSTEFATSYLNTAEQGNPNAIQICGKWLQDSKTYALSRLLSGAERIAPRVCTVVKVIPRHIYFVVDISRSGEYDSFIQQLKPNGKIDTLKDVRYSQCYDSLSCRRDIADPVLDVDDDGNAGLLKICQNRNNPPPGVSCEHYFSDYVRKVTFGDEDYKGDSFPANEKAIHPSPDEEDHRFSLHLDGNGSWGSEDDRNSFFINAYSPDGSGYPSPEPLTTIINGVHNAIGTLKSRRVTGDKAGVIFFTNGLVWPRITKLTSDLDTLYDFTDYKGKVGDNGLVLESDSFDDNISQELASLVNYKSGLERAIRNSIFPVPSYRRVTDGRPDTWAFSNISEALYLALTYMGAAEEDAVSQLDPNIARSVFLFSDGLQNCRPNSAGDAYECENNNLNYYLDGMADLKEKVINAANSMKNLNIPLHVFQAGATVGPHFVAKKKDECKGWATGCFTDAECRASAACCLGSKTKGLVKTDDTGDLGKRYAEMSASAPFYTASYDMYTLSLATGGVYVPLRKKDRKCGEKECDIGEECDSFDCSDYENDERIETDPQCRTLARQIQDGMDVALGGNPYRIVDVQ